jgi:hypothetical protein
VKNQFWYLYKMTRKIKFLCILILIFVDRKREEQEFQTERYSLS